MARNNWTDLSRVSKAGWVMVPTTLLLSNLYMFTDDGALAHRLYPLGLLLLVACYTAVLFYTVPSYDRYGKLIIGLILAAECWEILLFSSCKLFDNPFNDLTIQAWGAELAKSSCERMYGSIPRWAPVGIYLAAFGYIFYTTFLRKRNGNSNT